MSLTAEELREIRRLHLQAGRRVDSVFAGEYRSMVRGRGMEFEEVRNYVPGDDVRHIDWNVTARTGEPHVKVYREERQNTLMLAVDISGSTRVARTRRHVPAAARAFASSRRSSSMGRSWDCRACDRRDSAC